MRGEPAQDGFAGETFDPFASGLAHCGQGLMIGGERGDVSGELGGVAGENIAAESAFANGFGEFAGVVGDGDDRATGGEQGDQFAGEKEGAGTFLLGDQADVGVAEHGAEHRFVLQGQEADREFLAVDALPEIGCGRAFSGDDEGDLAGILLREDFRGVEDDIETLFFAEVSGIDDEEISGGNFGVFAEGAGGERGFGVFCLFPGDDPVGPKKLFFGGHALLVEHVEHSLRDTADNFGAGIGETFDAVENAGESAGAKESEGDGGVGLHVLDVKKIRRSFQESEQPGGGAEGKGGADDDEKVGAGEKELAEKRGENEAGFVEDAGDGFRLFGNELPAAVDFDAVLFFAAEPGAFVGIGFLPGGIIGEAGDHAHLVAPFAQPGAKIGIIGGDPRWLRCVVDSPDSNFHPLR